MRYLVTTVSSVLCVYEALQGRHMLERLTQQRGCDVGYVGVTDPGLFCEVAGDMVTMNT